MERVALSVIAGPAVRVDEEGWKHRRWTVELERAGRRMRSPFLQGMGHELPPTAFDVLSCMLLDASGFVNGSEGDASFREWADEFVVWDEVPVEKRARYRHTYQAVAKQTRELRVFLADDFDALVWPTDDHEEAARRVTE